MLELRKGTLESQGYCVKLASSGYTATKMLERTSVVAVLLEYKQEGIDAEAVACHIKATVSQPADHSALGLLRDAGANPVVGR
jgi:response regulator RpfG family c-di-GMP phosphodiesterase